MVIFHATVMSQCFIVGSVIHGTASGDKYHHIVHPNRCDLSTVAPSRPNGHRPPDLSSVHRQ